MREAVAALRWRERETTDTTIRPYLTSLRAALEGDREKSLAALGGSATLPIDAEALHYLARTFARLGAAIALSWNPARRGRRLLVLRRAHTGSMAPSDLAAPRRGRRSKRPAIAPSGVAPPSSNRMVKRCSC